VIQFENLTDMLSTTLNYEKFSACFIITAGYMALLCTVFGTVTTTTTVSFYIITREVYYH
jgi:hypothetical protein